MLITFDDVLCCFDWKLPMCVKCICRAVKIDTLIQRTLMARPNGITLISLIKTKHIDPKPNSCYGQYWHLLSFKELNCWEKYFVYSYIYDLMVLKGWFAARRETRTETERKLLIKYNYTLDNIYMLASCFIYCCPFELARWIEKSLSSTYNNRIYLFK